MNRIAYRLSGPGDVDAFERIETPIAAPEPGWVVVAVRAFGLNRSELFSRKGLSSPDLSFPRVLGLECVGEILDPGDTDLAAGDTVMALMGGMGRSYDGGYATHAVVPRRQVFRVETSLAWPEFGAIPETYNTAWGVCIENMQLTAADRVLIRGGTSALGMACGSIARDLGCDVAGTTRNPDKAAALSAGGVVDSVILDGPDFVERVRSEWGTVTAVVECVGSNVTVETSCATMPEGGKLGLVGMLAETWDAVYQPEVPANVETTFTRSDETAWPADQEKLETIVALADAGRLRPNIHRVFGFDELPEAHRVMEANEAVGKLVVTAP